VQPVRLAALLRDDVRCSMPPTPGLYVGRDTVLNDWIESGFESMTGLRAVLTSANRQPAVAFSGCRRTARNSPGVDARAARWRACRGGRGAMVRCVSASSPADGCRKLIATVS
jgi:hypothetical protein